MQIRKHSLRKAAQRVVEGVAMSAIAMGVTAANATTHEGVDHTFRSAGEITRASDLIGREVERSDGEDVGEISDIAISTETGRVGYVVIERDGGGLFGRSQTFVAVPLQRLQQQVGDDDLVLDVSDAELASLQNFDAPNWPLQAAIPASKPGALVSSAATGKRPTTAAAPAASQIARERYPAGHQAGGNEGTVSTATTDQTGDESHFDRLDQNGDGYLWDSELTEASFPHDFTQADANSDGRLSRVEFYSAGRESLADAGAGSDVQPHAGEDASITGDAGPRSVRFDQLDADGDGVLSQVELDGEVTVEAQISKADADGDGNLDRVEFAAFETQQVGPDASVTIEASPQAPTKDATHDATGEDSQDRVGDDQ